MRITRLEPFILHVPVTRGGVADSTHTLSHWGMPGVIIHTDTAHRGYGYCGTHAHLPSDKLITSAITDLFGPLLIGEDPTQTQHLFHKLDRYPINIWIGRAGVTQMALSAIDIALWDLKAKAAGQPLWQLLGGSDTKRITAYNTDAGWLNFTQQQLIDDCKRLIEVDGFDAVKMKVGKPDAKEDLARVEAVRKAIGDQPRLMVDANGKWHLADAIQYGRRIADFDVTWFEEPLWHDDVTNHKRLAEAITTPIALGELLYTVDAFRQFIECGAVHYVQPDVMRLGGITNWWTIAELTLAHRLPLVPHHGDMMQAQIHLCLAHRACTMLEYIPWTLHCFEEPAKVEAGVYAVPRLPGAGTTVKAEAMGKYNVMR
ncbi:MAG: mandelate racemase/muconate lactonizing enzyme family protein [Phycisphaeraceae bacterium]